MTRLRLVGLALLMGFAACQSSAGAGAVEPDPRSMNLGHWEGTRRGADGQAHPMTTRIEPILEGTGAICHLEVHHDQGVYRGFSVQVFDPKLGLWVRQYVNATRGSFTRLEGRVDSEKSVWRTVNPERTRDSRLVSEYLPSGLWRRTMSICEVGTDQWQVLWIDELKARQ